MRLVVDTCVLIDGALDPRSTAAQLPSLLAGATQFVICRWALDEARSVIEKEVGRHHERGSVMILLVEAFAHRLSQLLVDDGSTYLPRNKDAHGRSSVHATRSDAILTRNVRDFSDVPCMTAVELLRRSDPTRWAVEAPWPSPTHDGTVGIGCRCWPGDSFGWMLAGERGIDIGIDPVGRLRVRGTTPKPITQQSAIPHGRKVVVFARISNGRNADVTFIDREAQAIELQPVGRVTFSHPIRFRPYLKYLPHNDWNMECTWTGAINRRLPDKALALVGEHETTEVVASGVSLADVARKMVVLRHEGFGLNEIAEVALPRSVGVLHLRPQWRRG